MLRDKRNALISIFVFSILGILQLVFQIVPTYIDAYEGKGVGFQTILFFALFIMTIEIISARVHQLLNNRKIILHTLIPPKEYKGPWAVK